jgi:hypothetical protein
MNSASKNGSVLKPRCSPILARSASEFRLAGASGLCRAARGNTALGSYPANCALEMERESC